MCIRDRGYRLAEALGLCRRAWGTLTRGSLIGTGIGILPAAGGSIASLVAYSETRRASRHPQTFGTGEPRGLMASESANNATVGGGLIPTFVLGIPGTPADAVILGALLIHGVRTGPALFTERAALIYTFIFGLFIATLLMLPVGLLMGRYAYGAIVSIPKTFLVPLVAFFTIIGSYAIHNDVNDVVAMLALGVFAWLVGRLGIPAAPMVLGLLLGPIAEQGYGQAVIIGTATGSVGAQFFGRPIALAIIALIVITLLAPPLVRRYLQRGTP